MLPRPLPRHFGGEHDFLGPFLARSTLPRRECLSARSRRATRRQAGTTMARAETRCVFVDDGAPRRGALAIPRTGQGRGEGEGRSDRRATKTQPSLRPRFSTSCQRSSSSFDLPHFSSRVRIYRRRSFLGTFQERERGAARGEGGGGRKRFVLSSTDSPLRGFPIDTPARSIISRTPRTSCRTRPAEFPLRSESSAGGRWKDLCSPPGPALLRLLRGVPTATRCQLLASTANVTNATTMTRVRRFSSLLRERAYFCVVV